MFRPGESVGAFRQVRMGLSAAVFAVLVGCVSSGSDTGEAFGRASGTAMDRLPGKEAARPWSGIGRLATSAEVTAWDIDVRADFKGLPPGSGSVDKGMAVWEDKCASCHGTFGESNEVFTPIVGGTSKQDILSGRVANLARHDFPQRTTLMKASQLSTLWDYINRAMPWNAPKSLTVEEVYAVTAYILHLGDIVPSDFVLSDTNMAQVQARLPNRNGTVRFEGLWNVRGTPDVTAVACMKDCPIEHGIGSALPDYARNAHGQLASQHRVVGPVRGTDSDQPPSPRAAELARAAAAASMKAPLGESLASAASMSQGAVAADSIVAALARETGCLACHALDGRLVGPGLREVAARYKDAPQAQALLVARVRAGGQGVWGAVPMPPQAQLSDLQAQDLVRWILAGAR